MPSFAALPSMLFVHGPDAVGLLVARSQQQFATIVSAKHIVLDILQIVNDGETRD